VIGGIGQLAFSNALQTENFDSAYFGTDEALDLLGTRLSLPPFMEPRRAQIEAGLRSLD
jgi:hypothetical protein